MKIGKYNLSIIFWLDRNCGVEAVYILPSEDPKVVVEILFLLSIHLAINIQSTVFQF